MTTTHEAQALKLAAAVDLIDNLAHDAMSEIAAIARLALKSLESPDSYGHLDNIAFALQAIWAKAGETNQCIHQEAVAVQCGYEDPAEMRRVKAWHAFTEQQAQRARAAR